MWAIKPTTYKPLHNLAINISTTAESSVMQLVNPNEHNIGAVLVDFKVDGSYWVLLLVLLRYGASSIRFLNMCQ